MHQFRIWQAYVINHGDSGQVFFKTWLFYVYDLWMIFAISQSQTEDLLETLIEKLIENNQLRVIEPGFFHATISEVL